MRRLALVVLALTLLAPACSMGRADPSPSPTGDPELWRQDPDEPYPFVTPIPPRAPTPLDGEYTRTLTAADGAAVAIPCRRCAPYRLTRGPTVLTLDAGRFTIVQDAAAFRSSGHYAVEGDRIVLFNDPVCSTTRGTYRWSLVGGRLSFQVVDDDCAYDQLRVRYLAAAPWEQSGA